MKISKFIKFKIIINIVLTIMYNSAVLCTSAQFCVKTTSTPISHYILYVSIKFVITGTVTNARNSLPTASKTLCPVLFYAILQNS